MKACAILEITNKVARLVLGNVIDGEPVIYCVTERSIEGLVFRGEIADLDGMVEVLKSLANVNIASLELRVKLTDCTLIIPPLGLSIFETDKTTKGVSQTNIIEQIDIQNVLSQFAKEKVLTGSEIIDIVPDYFQLDQDVISIEPPLGQKSSSLTLKAKVYSMPSRIVNQYREAVLKAGLRPKRILVSSYSCNEFVKLNKFNFKNYFSIDMGAELTSISLIGNNSLVETSVTLLGGNDLSLYIAEQFDIDPIKASELQEKFGIDDHVLSFDPIIYKGNKEIRLSNLIEVIKNWFEIYYFKQIDAGIKHYVEEYSEQINTLPLVLTGGFSNLKGIEKMFKDKYTQSVSINFVVPKFPGVRNAKYSSSVGGLIDSTRYKGSLSDTRAKVSSVERVKSE